MLVKCCFTGRTPGKMHIFVIMVLLPRKQMLTEFTTQAQINQLFAHNPSFLWIRIARQTYRDNKDEEVVI